MLKVREVKVQLLHVAAEKFKFRNSVSLHNIVFSSTPRERWEGASALRTARKRPIQLNTLIGEAGVCPASQRPWSQWGGSVYPTPPRVRLLIKLTDFSCDLKGSAEQPIKQLAKLQKDAQLQEAKKKKSFYLVLSVKNQPASS